MFHVLFYWVAASLQYENPWFKTYFPVNGQLKNQATSWTTEELKLDSQEGQEMLHFCLCQNRLWGQPTLLYNTYSGLFPRRQIGWSMKLTIQFPHIVAHRAVTM
jgi:hypothetical protein